MFKKLMSLLVLVSVAGLFAAAVNADPLRQDTGPDGIVSVEAEDYDGTALGENDSAWELVGPTEGFTGDAGMQVNGAGTNDTNYSVESPRLDYEIDFVKTGPHYVWIRAWGATGADDSCHAGLDGEETPLSNRMSGWNNNYTWANGRYERPEPSQIEITTTGVHTLNIWMREDGLIVDKIVLTTNPDYRPTGEGPEPSHRGARLKAYDPIPADGAVHEDNWVSLNWSEGETSISHDVYFGDDFDEVNDGAGDTFRGNQGDAFYVAGFPGFAFPDGLDTGKTYYWRIDEVEADGTTHKGDVWSFAVPARTAHNPSPADGGEFIDPNTELNWTSGLGSKLHTVYFGDNFDDVNDATVGMPQAETTYTPGTLEFDKTYYWRVDEFSGAETHKGKVWSFTTIPEIPVDNPNLVGWWKLDAGKGTRAIDWSGYGKHGTLEDNPQWGEGFDGVGLEFDGANFVELDTSEMIGTGIGSVSLWIKTTQSDTGMVFYGSSGSAGNGFGDQDEMHINMMGGGGVEFYIEGGDNDANPEGTVVNDDSWHHITATWDINGDVQLYVDGGEPVTVPHTGNEFNLSGTIRLGRPVSRERFYTGLIDDVRLYNYVLSADEIALIMRGDVNLAWNPKPANGSTSSIDNVTSVSWSAGDNAAEHDVYFGTEKEAVADADESTADIYRGRQGGTSYTPPEGIEWGRTYYWRIDELNTDETISRGRLWSFTIADHIVVDDFESYNDLDPAEPDSNRIFNAWIDGFDNPASNGSIVGYATPPFAEQTIVHGGSQSMPFFYDNSVGLSEATLTLTYPRDWSRHGIGILSLWYRGNPAGFGEQPDGTIVMNASGSDIWGTSDEFRYAYKELSGAGSITAQVLSVENTDPWAKVGVMIRQTLDPGSKFAAVYITPGNGCRFQARLTPGSSATSDTADDAFTPEQTAITAPYWIRLERDAVGNFEGFYSSDGVSWQAMPWNPQNISMPANVYVGLAVTSHSEGVNCEAVFSDVTTTGSVSPAAWSHEAIGVEMASNDPEPMYAALNGNAVVTHENPDAALVTDWTEWRIDLTGFTDQGVNLGNVDTLSIGFGNKSNPQPGGSGSVFFDDIQLQRP
jgi:hypothetical protein